MTNVNTFLASLADAILIAEEGERRAHAALCEVQAHSDMLYGRIQTFRNRRAAIVERRAGGDCQDGDGPELALIAADSEGLQSLTPSADATLAAARAESAQATSERQAAKQAYQTMEHRIALAALDDHADKLIDLLQETMRQRGAVAANLLAEDCALERAIEHLSAVDEMFTENLTSLRALAKNPPFRFRLKWKPSTGLYEQLYRLNGSNGAFA